EVAAIMGLTSVAALAYLMFNLFAPPCFAAIGAMNVEMDSRKWLWAGIGFQFGVGYTVAYFVYQIGTLITTGAFGSGVIPGLLVVFFVAAVIACLIRKNDKRLKFMREEAA
ncbi:MAG: ferrous iron transporter B, partial [Firmicutes bacterium]|nr:ferrous iron transporter B [Bacillota bacterium]